MNKRRRRRTLKKQKKTLISEKKTLLAVTYHLKDRIYLTPILVKDFKAKNYQTVTKIVTDPQNLSRSPHKVFPQKLSDE